MINFQINDAEVFQLIKQIQARGDNMKPVMAAISQTMFEEVRQNFESEGPRWPALAPATIAQREKLGYWPGKMLQRSGQLLASVAARSNANQAIVGTNKKYAALQFLGGQAGRGHKVTVPGRNPLTLKSSTVGKIRFELLQYLLSKQ